MYFPPSQIETNLYTDGSEYELSTNGEPYTGPYWKIKRNGALYTGNSPETSNPIQLVLIQTEENTQPDPYSQNEFLSQVQSSKTITIPGFNRIPDIMDSKITSRILPLPYSVILTEDDIKQNYVTRYFIKRNDVYQYMEISSLEYTKLSNKDDTIAWDLYSGAILTWVISGDINTVSLGNAKRVRNIMEKKSPKNPSGKNWIGFDTLFNNNYLQFYQSNISKSQSNRTTSNSISSPQSSTSGGSGGGGY
tara:strand:+ start:396 stop:1142 length:747 start_codon:yes stop_codon:yes gene_type:complete